MSKKIFYDKIRLGSGMSLMVGNMPDQLGLEAIANSKPNLDVSKFGLFESATPNFHTFYPDVKNAEDIKPQEGDFVKPIFRLLSEVIVRKKTYPTDFSKNGVLKSSMNKLLGQTVYANHEALVGNEIGSVAGVTWQNSYTTKNGIKVPAGILGEFKIDSKAHPNIARKILMEPPAIHSNSVTVEFAWEQSHPQMDQNDFWSKLGTFASDGELIRRVVTEIKNYHETSLVAHGADPFAQVVDKDGKIVNPEYANSVYSLSAQGKEKPQMYFFSCREDILDLSNEEDNSTLNNPNNKSEETMKELVAQLSKLLNKPEAEITEKFIQDWFSTNFKDAESLKHLEKLGTIPTLEADLATANTSLTAEKTKTTDLTTKLTEAEGKVTNLTSDLAKYKPAMEAHTTQLRASVKKAYETLKGDKADAAVLDLIEKADLKGLEAYAKQYNDELEEKMPATCKACGSTDVARNSATQSSEGEQGAKDTTKMSDYELGQQLLKESKGGFIFDKDNK